MSNRHVSWSRKLGDYIFICKHKAEAVNWKGDDSDLSTLPPTPMVCFLKLPNSTTNQEPIGVISDSNHLSEKHSSPGHSNRCRDGRQ